MHYSKHRITLLLVALMVGFVTLGLGVVTAQAEYQEAPELAALVKGGQLPPVEERLPVSPMVVEPVERVGTYGGTWTKSEVKQGSETAFIVLNYEPLVRWGDNGRKLIPNVAESWTISDDAKTITFFLREGIKWSDGVPLTANDILFWYECIILNKKLTPTQPAWLSKLETVKALDDYTIEFDFVDSDAIFLENLASGPKACEVIQPAHYLKQFHPAHVAEDTLEAEAKKQGYDSWYARFDFVADEKMNADKPVIGAWKLVASEIDKQILTRNPYYWKVDTAGNQLPYIDKVVIEVVLNVETITMKAATGQTDFQPYRLSISDFTLFKENEESGDYRLLLWDTSVGSNMGLMPNLNHQDPEMNKLFNNRDFRIALSLAIDRDEINDLCYMGLGEARQATVVPGNPHYTDELSQLYAEYDPDKANEILDNLGLKRNKHGQRLLPDGRVIEITIITTPDTLYGPWVDAADLVAKYWSAVGIKTAYESLSSSLYSLRRNSVDFDVMTWAWGRGSHPLIEPVFLFPVLTTTGAPLYARWYTSGGTDGEEPPAEMREVMSLYGDYCTTADDEARLAIGQEIVERSARELWTIGTVGRVPTPLVAKNNFRNVPEVALYEYMLGQIGHVNAPQFFIED
ncbi:MAG: ABC transporter substrate-binding protein [Firmicutes bacterium]|nr:ABC transporter substrate-binding protein [Bacillota bacterium]